jgi:hypothetical protein
MVGGLHPTLKKEWYIELPEADHQSFYGDRGSPSGPADL